MKVEKLINRYIDGQATSQERKDVELRLENDQEFAKLFSKFEEVDRLLQKIENDVVAEDITLRVLNSVKYQDKTKPFMVRYAPALVGSMMSFVLGIVFSSFVITTQESSLNKTSSYNGDLYSTLEIDELINYYYDN